MKRRLVRDRLVLSAFLGILVAFGVLAARHFLLAPPPAPAPVQPEAEPRRLREVMLYFGAAEGSRLQAEAGKIEDCLEEQACIGATVQALVNGPAGDLVPVIPPHVQLRGVAVEEGTAIVDFSRELVTGHPGGSTSELLTVFGLADTLAVNFPHIRQVRILVEGQPVETIKGHVDLTEPVQVDFRFARPTGEGGGAGSPAASGDEARGQEEEGR